MSTRAWVIATVLTLGAALSVKAQVGSRSRSSSSTRSTARATQSRSSGSARAQAPGALHEGACRPLRGGADAPEVSSAHAVPLPSGARRSSLAG